MTPRTTDPTPEAERFYIKNMDAWEATANSHMNDPDTTGTLACALLTLIQAYRYAAGFAETEE